jgi:hypothetical protein
MRQRWVAKTSATPERELWKCRGCGKRGKPKAGFPLFPQPLGNLAKSGRDSHISTAPATKADGKVENQKQVSHFPTAFSWVERRKNQKPPTASAKKKGTLLSR